MVPVYDKIVPALLDGGVWNLGETCSFSLGIPCEPMLSASAKSVSEIVNRYRGIEYSSEYKYDIWYTCSGNFVNALLAGSFYFLCAFQ